MWQKKKKESWVDGIFFRRVDCNSYMSVGRVKGLNLSHSLYGYQTKGGLELLTTTILAGVVLSWLTH